MQHYSNTNKAKKVGHLLTAVSDSKLDQHKTWGNKKNRKKKKLNATSMPEKLPKENRH
jgi:hypothetical protein